MVQLSATKYNFIAVLWVSLVSFATITFCIASQRVFIVVYFVIDSVRKLFDTPSYVCFSVLFSLLYVEALWWTHPSDPTKVLKKSNF
jgi:hypothetical protein